MARDLNDTLIFVKVVEHGSFIAAAHSLRLPKTSVSRNLYSFQQDANSYYVADTFSIGPVWAITAKTKVWARYDLSSRDYRGAIIQTTERRDTVQGFAIGGEWKPLRTVTVGAALQRDTRASNFGGLDYEANAASIYAQLLF